jgi:thiamine biosynthesis lipoprotein ApbE
MTADAFATVAGVVDWEETRALVASCPGIGVLAITADGDQLTCGEW